ncbi:MAG: hypothetical protein U9R05_10035 [Chloroflexota bacterium]|nr:hypothetical protein [Chloroflexota bacterium]
MSDDLRDAFGDDIFMEPEEEELEIAGEETQNKTFLFAVAGLGALLFLAIAAFIIWAVILNPIQQGKLAAQNEQTQATNEAIAIARDSTATAEARPTQEEAATAESPPTATPTPVIQATHTPTPLPTVTGDEGEEATATPTATPRPRRTATPTPTSGDSSTTSGPDKPPDTGLGDLLPIIGAVLLLGLIVFARRLRKA